MIEVLDNYGDICYRFYVARNKNFETIAMKNVNEKLLVII